MTTLDTIPAGDAPSSGISASDLSLRKGSLADLVARLEKQNAATFDTVAPVSHLESHRGVLRVRNAYPHLTADGVTAADLALTPTASADLAVADKLRIPRDYLRRLHTDHVDLYDANVNGLLSATDPRTRYLVRGLVDNQGHGFLRTLLSDNYKIIDNLDVLSTALLGIKDTGQEVSIAQADLTETRMFVKVHSPAVAAMAPELLRGYRSPFTGATGADNPTIFAGFVLSNSETGNGALRIIPQLTVQICTNGMTFTQHACRHVHLGAKLPEGSVQWSDDTQDRLLDLIRATTRDAVRWFLSPQFLQARITELQADAGVAISDPDEVLTQVSTEMKFSKDARTAIFNRFIDGGDRSSGGVLHAVTAAAQDMPDPAEAYDLEARGMAAMRTAARIAVAA